MHIARSFLQVVSLLIVMVAFLLTGGCAKDYSYERQPADTSSRGNTSSPVISSCALCNNNVLPDSSWRFTIDGVVYCGKAGKSVTMPERTAFTFFGPSFCSADSGFVASVYVENNVLDGDKKELRARLSCYYYDKVRPSYVFMSSGTEPLAMIIADYSYQNGTATGTFGGVVQTESGQRKEIKNGQFRIRLQ